jgi:hypothetical protein
MVSTFVLFGITIAITSLSLLSALAGWYYCLTAYRQDLSERGYDALKYVLPPFVLLSASPLFDVVLWQAGIVSGAEWPLIGAKGMIVGLGGVAVVVGFVVYDLRSEPSTAPGGVGTGSS